MEMLPFEKALMGELRKVGYKVGERFYHEDCLMIREGDDAINPPPPEEADPSEKLGFALFGGATLEQMGYEYIFKRSAERKAGDSPLKVSYSVYPLDDEEVSGHGAIKALEEGRYCEVIEITAGQRAHRMVMECAAKLQFGKPSRMFEDPSSVEGSITRFISQSSMTIYPGRLGRDERGESTLDENNVVIALLGTRGTKAVREEAAKIAAAGHDPAAVANLVVTIIEGSEANYRRFLEEDESGL